MQTQYFWWLSSQLPTHTAQIIELVVNYLQITLMTQLIVNNLQALVGYSNSRLYLQHPADLLLGVTIYYNSGRSCNEDKFLLLRT